MSTLPPDIEAFVQQKIASGEFGSREELAVEALRLYREMESRRAQLKADIQAGIDEADRGLSEPLDMEAIEAELLAEFEENGRLE